MGRGQDVGVEWDWLGSSYDRVASTYEARFADELRGKPGDRALLEAFAASVDDPVVDLGCGPGQIGAHVARCGRVVFGVDLSGAMARLATNRLSSAVVAHLAALPFSGGRVGGLVAFSSLIHLPRSQLHVALEEWHRVLRPGGRVLFSVHEGQGDVHVDEFLDEQVPFCATYFELDELIAAARSVGFEISGAERREPYPTEGLRTVRLYVEAERVARDP